MITLPRFVGGLIDLFARRESQPQQQIMINLLDMWARNRPLAHLWDVKKFVDEGYRRNTLVFACVKNLAVSFSEPALVAMTYSDTDEQNELPQSHMLARLLEHPNSRQSQTAFFREYSTHLDVAGNVFAYKVRSRAGIPVQLRLLRPDLIRPVPDDNGDITTYAYGNEPNVQTIPARDVIHEMCDPDPLDPYRGLSPIAVLARMGDLDNNAADYLRAFFLNAGIPSGILKYKTMVEPEQRERARQLWREKYSGLRGWNEIAVLDGDVEYEEIGSKLRTMDLEGVFGQTESRICMTYGMPPILIGSWLGLSRSTYANYNEATKRYYRGTLKPKWISTEDRFTTDLAAEFGTNLRLKFDLSEIDALQEDRAEARTFALAAWSGGLARKNEARKIAGLPLLEQGEGGDEFKPAAAAPGFPLPDAMALGAFDRLMLPRPGETFDAIREAQWRALHRIADAAAPSVKKKSSERLPRPRAVLQ